MTREELKAHCIRQVEQCERWARHNGEEPHGKIYEEHKMILELLEQESILDKIISEIDRQQKWLLQAGYTVYNVDIALDAIKAVVAEGEPQESESKK